MEFCRITEQTLGWFAPLIPTNYQEEMKQGELYAIGAAEDKTACGVLLFRQGNPAVEILYLAVSPAYRRRGCATGMIRWLCRYAEPTATPVFCSFVAEDKEDPMYLLFADMPEFTVEQQEGVSRYLPMEELDKQPLLIPQDNVHPVPFFSLPKGMQRAFQDKLLREQDFDLDLNKELYLQDLCLCSMEEDQIQAVMFARAVGEEDVYLDYIWRAPGFTPNLLSLLGTAAGTLQGRSGSVYFGAVNEQSQRLAEKLFPQAENLGAFYEAAWDMTVEGGEDYV